MIPENRGLFEEEPEPAAPALSTSIRSPLAERMRPRSLDEFEAPPGLTGRDSLLGRAAATGSPPSIVFWGPPGSGKTTLARILAATANALFVEMSAVTSGVKETRAQLENARKLRRRGQRSIVFLDEIHRFNRAQQDVFLPFVEAGDVILFGATTENPSFELNGALLSRLRVVILPPLSEESVERLIERALADPERGLGGSVALTREACSWLVRFSDGDARRALNALEIAAQNSDPGGQVTVEFLEGLLQKKVLLYDRAGEGHFNLISALHKSLRDSDVDAGLYWLARMLEAGEDPLYVARRLIRFASEDVGLADPTALTLAVAAKDAVHFIGLPEGALALAELVVHLALAPKSNAIYVAYSSAVADVQNFPNEGPPLAIRNAVTALMKGAGYGAGYVYAHDTEEGTAGLSCLPDSLAGRRYYEPAGRGHEAAIKERLGAIRRLREELSRRAPGS